jgi:putative ABC transport system permease protein
LKEQKTIPPKLANRILLFFLRDDLAEEVLGDLDEKFIQTIKNGSAFRAKLNYWYQVLNYMRPFAIRKSASRYLNDYAMFKNYFKIGWRSLLKQKIYSSIKIGGFAAGIAACLLIGLFIRYELSYDRHYVNTDRIYRILRQTTFRGEAGVGIHFPAPLVDVLEKDYPEFEKAGHYLAVEHFGAGSNEVRRTDRSENTHEDGLIFMSQGLVEILEIPFLQGNGKSALKEPLSIVITERKAKKYFSGEDPIGKSFILNNDESKQYTVTGVVADFPANSHIQCDFILTTSGKEFWKGEQTDWRASNYIDYVRVRPGTDIAAIEKKLLSVLKTYFLPAAIDHGGDAEEVAWLKSMRFKLQPVHAIYLNEYGVGDDLKHGEWRYIWLFGSIATFILLIACINFINLSTARSANRAREVGLRKVVGSLRSSLVKQFLTESLLYSYFSFSLGLLLAFFLLPYFNLLVAKSLVFPWTEWWLFPILVAAACVIGILAGLYPSLYLSSFKPIQVLKGNVSRGSKNSSTRSLLVVFQFSVAIVLIVGTFAINRQMNFILNKKLGYDKDQVLLLQGTHTLENSIVTFKNELLRVPGVKHASITGFLPVDDTRRNGGPVYTEGMAENEKISSQQWSVDHDYVKTLGLKIVKGRDFNIEMPSDSQAMIINETMARAFNFKDPIGQTIFNWKGAWTVVGVVEDFHFESMKERIQPMALYIGRSANTVSVKLNTTDMQSTIASVTKVWKQFSPNQPIRFTFLDQQYAQMYDDVDRMGKIFTSFAVLAIIVACLGLFALSSFMVEQRSKEISIRVVLGASVKSIFQLLTKNFVKLVLISFVIATPIAWLMMQKWLQDYQYKIDITMDIFLLAGFFSLAIAVLTISYQAIRAALSNPVESLRSE